MQTLDSILVADTAVLDAAKGDPRVVHLHRVAPNGSRLDSTRDSVDCRVVVTPKRSTQTVGAVVDTLEQFRLVLPLDQREMGAIMSV